MVAATNVDQIGGDFPDYVPEPRPGLLTSATIKPIRPGHSRRPALRTDATQHVRAVDIESGTFAYSPRLVPCQHRGSVPTRGRSGPRQC